MSAVGVNVVWSFCKDLPLYSVPDQLALHTIQQKKKASTAPDITSTHPHYLKSNFLVRD